MRSDAEPAPIRSLIKDVTIEGHYVGFTPFELRIDNAWVVGTYQHDENRVCISHADCEGLLSTFMKYLVKKFNTNKVLIYGVMSMNWHLRGFYSITMIDEIYNEKVLCLQGEWVLGE